VLKEEGIRGLLRYCHRAGGPGREGRKLRYAPARKPNSITPDAWRRYATSKALPIRARQDSLQARRFSLGGRHQRAMKSRTSIMQVRSRPVGATTPEAARTPRLRSSTHGRFPLGPLRQKRHELLDYEAPRTGASRWGHHLNYTQLHRISFRPVRSTHGYTSPVSKRSPHHLIRWSALVVNEEAVPRNGIETVVLIPAGNT
jgi:hypothetical protein